MDVVLVFLAISGINDAIAPVIFQDVREHVIMITIAKDTLNTLVHIVNLPLLLIARGIANCLMRETLVS